MNLNYFKCAGHIFMFSETSPSPHPTAVQAYDAARELNEPISIYRVTLKPGVWDRASVIGHRSRKEILLDIERCRSPHTKAFLHAELDSLETCYRNAGRRGMPLMSVAA